MRPYVTVTNVVLQDLAVGLKPRVKFEYTTGGQVAAYQVQFSSRITLATKPDYVPDFRNLQITKIDQLLAPSTKFFSSVFATWDVTKERIDQIKNGKCGCMPMARLSTLMKTETNYRSISIALDITIKLEASTFIPHPTRKLITFSR